MAQGKMRPKERQIGKKTVEKKTLINPKYKNTIWTAVIVLILLIFFIVNNTRSVPDQGPYPPSYTPGSSVKADTVVDKKLNMNTESK